MWDGKVALALLDMTDKSPVKISLRDPLSEVTRKERRALLGVSVLSLFISKAGMMPSEITALGVKLGQTDQHAFLNGMSLVVGYFLVAFILYGLSDFIAWKISFNESCKEVYRQTFGSKLHPNSAHDIYKDWVPLWPNHLAPSLSVVRILFEFLLPVAVGGYTILSLVSSIK